MTNKLVMTCNYVSKTSVYVTIFFVDKPTHNYVALAEHIQYRIVSLIYIFTMAKI